jgi:hypothetical protein
MKFISNYKCVGNKVFLSTGHILIEAEGEIEMCLSIDDYIILLLDWKHAQNGAMYMVIIGRTHCGLFLSN